MKSFFVVADVKERLCLQNNNFSLQIVSLIKIALEMFENGNK